MKTEQDWLAIEPKSKTDELKFINMSMVTTIREEMTGVFVVRFSWKSSHGQRGRRGRREAGQLPQGGFHAYLADREIRLLS
jgi:hypothetical protein